MKLSSIQSGSNKGWATEITLNLEDNHGETCEIEMTLSEMEDMIDQMINLYDRIRRNSYMVQ